MCFDRGDWCTAADHLHNAVRTISLSKQEVLLSRPSWCPLSHPRLKTATVLPTATLQSSESCEYAAALSITLSHIHNRLLSIFHTPDIEGELRRTRSRLMAAAEQTWDACITWRHADTGILPKLSASLKSKSMHLFARCSPT